MASKLSSPHRRKGFILECRSSKLRLGEKMPSTFWDAAFWGLLPPALSLSPLEFSAHATIASCRPLRSGRPARPRPREEGAQQLGHSRKQHRRHCLSQSLRHSQRRIRLSKQLPSKEGRFRYSRGFSPRGLPPICCHFGHEILFDATLVRQGMESPAVGTS